MCDARKPTSIQVGLKKKIGLTGKENKRQKQNSEEEEVWMKSDILECGRGKAGVKRFKPGSDKT